MPACRIPGVVLALVLFGAATVRAEDWSTYRHNNDRTGTTPEQLTLPLRPAWVYSAPARPKLGWAGPDGRTIEGKKLKHRVNFDDCFHVVVGGAHAYFGSSVDHQVRCVELKTGKQVWSFFTGGPVRLAPTLWQDRVLFGADDGYAYCLDTKTGKQIWQLRGGPDDDFLLGRGEMISRWPVRTNVTVRDGVAYFAAGIFPHEDVYLYAVDAKTGKVQWKLDDLGEEQTGRNPLSPQGYLLANANYLFVPSGRALPACFEPKSGKLLHHRTHSWRTEAGGVVGGTQAFLADGWIYASGDHHVLAMDQKTGDVNLGYFDGMQMAVVGEDDAFLATGTEIQRIERKIYARISALKLQIKLAVAKLAKLLPKGGKEADELTKQIEKLKKEQEAIKVTGIVWSTESESIAALIVAGDHVFVGGVERIDCLDAKTGKILWTEKVDDAARGLAVANGHLLVSTTSGKVYSFADAKQPKVEAVPQPKLLDDPYPQPKFWKEAAMLWEYNAEEILKSTGAKKGYCLIIGAEYGRLAYALAKMSELRIYAIEPDKEKVDSARKTLSAAGLYGHRIVVHHADLSDIPYCDYFANLIVSESFIWTGKLPGNPRDFARHVKPLGGVVCMGGPADALDVPAKTVQAWLNELATDAPGTIVLKGNRGIYTRGKLQGAANWTHQYGDPGNTASSQDQLVKGGLGVLWYGDPGPGEMVNRHEGAVGPLAVNGKLIVQGQFSVMAYDAYNGMFLWEHDNADVYRTGVFFNNNSGNLIASDNSVFIMEGTKVVQLDLETGKLKATHLLPEAKRKEYEWGFLAHQDGTLYGTATMRKELIALLKKRGQKYDDKTDAVFAIDVKSGKHLWTYEGKNIEAQTIALAPGKVYFIDRSITADQRDALMMKEKDKLKDLKGKELKAAEAYIKKLDVRMAVAVDGKTGQQLWAKPVDVTDCSNVGTGGGKLTLMVSQDVLVLCGANANGHYWKQFTDGEFKIRRLVALSAKDGNVLWAKDANYRHRPIIIGPKLIAEPWAFDLFTGKQIMQKNPLTGKEEPWSIIRPGHHCGMIVGAPNMLLFRSGSTGFYDLYNESGTQHFAGHRLGCWINALPANGLVMIPEASAGCVCQFSLEATITLAPRKAKHPWTIYSSTGPTLPVEHLSLNLGAPGDRKDGHGQVWLAYPRPKPERQTGLDLKLDLPAEFMPGGLFKLVSSQFNTIGSGDVPDWLFTSWAQGLKKLTVPLRGKKDGAAEYTVRLYFADIAKDAKPGQRVFDVKIQGKTVLKTFDPVADRKGGQVAVVYEIHGVHVEDSLVIELIASAEPTDPGRMPILNALEVIRTAAKK